MKLDLSKPFDLKKAEARFSKLCAKGAKIELTEFLPKRSISNNSYFHVVVAYFCQETGYNIDEAKTVLKRQYGLYYEKNGQKFIRSTTDLDDKEMCDFTEYIRTFCFEQLGVYVETPEEYRSNQFEIEKELQHFLSK